MEIDRGDAVMNSGHHRYLTLLQTRVDGHRHGRLAHGFTPWPTSGPVDMFNVVRNQLSCLKLLLIKLDALCHQGAPYWCSIVAYELGCLA